MIDRDSNGIEDRVDLHRIAVAAMTARGLLHELPAVPPAEPAATDGRDLTDLPWNSIDNASSRDLDQVEYAERHEGFTRVLVGIAEVSVFTPPGSALDLAAAHNAATVYTAAGVFPMIPRALSEGRTSLLDGEARRAMVTALDIADDGAVLRSEHYPAWVFNRGRMDYPSVSAWLAGGEVPDCLRDPVPGDFGRDDEAALSALKGFAVTEGSRVVYVGKLLVNKGVDLLLAAWPIVVDGLVADGRPIPRLLVVGFGSFEEGLQDLWSSIQSGDLDSASRTAQRGRELEGEQSGGKLRILSDFLRNPPEGYAEMGRVAANSVLWAGRLDHDEVAEVLPVSDALVMPSTFPEAFGMVAAEAAACGVPFVSADHSGMLEVSKRLGEALDPEAAPFLSFSVESDAIEQLADCLLHWLRMEPAEQAWISERLASAASDSYSWPAMAAALVAAASGDLDKLPHP